MEVSLVQPFPEYAWPRVWAWCKPFRHLLADDFAPKTMGEFVEARMASNWATAAIVRDGEICGLLALEPLNPVCGLVHIVVRRDAWGRDTTDRAVRLGLQAAFDSGLLKVCGHTFTDNRMARALHRRMGFREEGILRSHTMRGGKPADLVLCGLTKEEFANGTHDGAGRSTGRSFEHSSGAYVDKHHEPELQRGTVELTGAAGKYIN
jgi:RimJ/RimL family protein N-acetyltransferase